jgi:chromosome segregation protein
MKLEKIKLSGFKSFVDPTSIPIKGNLIGIVGPNGCGKSNIIDAVRWVMGESSAKHLRGGSMADVIFNGSSTRKPVSHAAVELVFDNSEGRAGGEFAKYNTISLKRQVSRDGSSLYELNGSRCRRKDITDLFLGTGLGARSYAIIEQGTISRMVEAKPEELRIHIEEAAGISKYKERRHETETRMRNTRENLERLEDLRDEVEKQRNHLQKQAQKAEKYTLLKSEERQYKLELLAMRWQAYHQSAADMEQKLQTVAEQHNQLFLEQRDLDQEITSKRDDYKTQQEQLNTVQGEYYHAVSEVSRLEQAIKHNHQSKEETNQELARLRQQAKQSLTELEDDKLQLESIAQDLLQADDSLLKATASEAEALDAQKQAQQQQQTWQQDWETYRTQSANFREQTEVQRTKISHLQNQNQQMQVRFDRLQQERANLANAELSEAIEILKQAVNVVAANRADTHQQLGVLHLNTKDFRQQVKALHENLNSGRSELHNVNGKISSLELLQQHAMGKDNKKLEQWLEQSQLSDKQRLAEFIEVEPGWESAVEIVLGTYLEAICIDDLEQLMPNLSALNSESVSLFETRESQSKAEDSPRLLDKVQTPWNVDALLSGVFCAENTESAKVLAAQLQNYQSVITPECVWLGPGWLKIIRRSDSKSGVLQRKKELQILKQRQNDLQADIENLEKQLGNTENNLKNVEQQREELEQKDKVLATELSTKNSEFSAQSARYEHQQHRLDQVGNEMDDITQEISENAESISEAEEMKDQAEQKTEVLDKQKLDLEQSNQSIQEKNQQVDDMLIEARQKVHQIQTLVSSLQTSESSTIKQLERLQIQHQHSDERIVELETKLQQTLSPLDNEELELKTLVATKAQLDGTLKNARTQQELTETEIATLSERHTQVQRDLEKEKEQLDSIRFEQQESVVRQQTVTEQLKEIDADAKQVLTTLPEDANQKGWKVKVEELTSQIERLGTINLSAIEEFQAQSERMDFLNEQYADLTLALNTLDQAISKIDKESRQRFKETFDKINDGLQAKFPKLFGGGQAYLELTEQDLLETGVNIIARPPGKRNSSIHLLSGGEKALTAVALVFSIFDLNPAPFCLLDEVDAPLDDANVVRFSQMVEDMSQSVQFLYISHNKVTIEIAKQLAGVTMREPGVSRMVAVDIEEAIGLVES